MPAKRRYTAAERALLRDARAFLRARADELDGMRQRARGLRDRLAATEAYRAVDGDDRAEHDPIWVIAGVLTSVYDDELETLADTLRMVARAPAAHRRRALPKPEGE